jgi:flagellar basal body-associated protein FliL
MHLGTFAIAVLLLGGGAGTYMSTPHAQWLGVKAYAGEKETREAEDSNRHKFLKFNALSMQILDDTGRSRAVIFNVSIEVPDSRGAQAVKANEPILTDAFIHDIYGLWNHDAAYRDGVVHADVIKDRLRRSSRRILGDENVTDVLLEVVDQQAM